MKALDKATNLNGRHFVIKSTGMVKGGALRIHNGEKTKTTCTVALSRIYANLGWTTVKIGVLGLPVPCSRSGKMLHAIVNLHYEEYKYSLRPTMAVWCKAGECVRCSFAIVVISHTHFKSIMVRIGLQFTIMTPTLVDG